MIAALGSLLLGLVLLIAGADALIRGAIRLGRAAGMSSLVMGLTIVALGTSSPEAAVSIYGAFAGNSGVAVGNVVGSNIFNVLVILGVASIVTPIVIPVQLLRLDLPFLVLSAVLAAVLASDGFLARGESAVLLTGGMVYLTLLYRFATGAGAPSSRSRTDGEGGSATATLSSSRGRLTASLAVRSLGWIAGGVLGLFVGSRFLVSGVSEIGASLGVSDLVMGVTVVAAGTSLPELATSMLAAFKAEYEVAVGNIIGSNISNLLFVLAMTGILAPAGLPIPGAALSFDIPVMVATSIACVPLFFTGLVVARWEGVLLAFYYVAYVAYLVLDARDHQALPWFSAITGLVVVPASTLVIFVLAVREIRRRRAKRHGTPCVDPG